MDREIDLSKQNLKKLTEEFLVGVKLGNHNHVSKLGFQISATLIELFEVEFENRYQSEDISRDGGSSENLDKISNILSEICHQIREVSNLARAYADVVEFVTIRDLVCLSRMLGAVPSGAQNLTPSDASCIDLDGLTTVLRQSIYLLKSMNKPPGNQKICWIDKESLRPITSIGFTRYMLDFDEIFSKEQMTRSEIEVHKDLEKLDQNFKILDDILYSRWFRHFIDRSLREVYPIDRFSILICIWQVAVECEHRHLQQLIGQLVDQLVHEERNSLNEEELMQLTQVGSFWLTHHKRCQSTTASKGLLNLRDDLQVGEFGDDQLYESDSSSMLDVSSATSDNQQRSTSAELRARLRCLIDDELIRGAPCVLCAHRTREPLETLACGFTCPQCNNSSDNRCSLSYQPLRYIELDALARFKPELAGLALISPSQWVRAAIQASRENSNKVTERGQVIGERVDINETFERLIVIRSEDNDEESTKSGESSEDDDDDDDDVNRSWDQVTDYETILASYMRANLSNSLEFSSRDIKRREIRSETWRLLRFVARQTIAHGTWLPVCSSDLLLLDKHKALVSLRLQSFNLHTQVWCCSARSGLANLRLGCGGLFLELELIRKCHNGVSLGEFSCALCDRRLTKVQCAL